jgi:hypothetical protein
MPFPSSSSTTSAPSDFDLSSTLSRITALQTQLSTTISSSNLLRRQIQREKTALKRDKKELKMLEDGLRGAREVRRRKERGLHVLVGKIDGEVDGEGEDARSEEVERVNAIAGITMSGSALSSRTAIGLTTSAMDSGTDAGPDHNLDALLAQLRSHLLSMRNNTASMMPVLEAMDEAKIALDTFISKSLDADALQRLYGAAATG